MDIQYDVIIIGAGPAGLSAAIYASRANLKTAILEYDAPGGKLVKTAEIANWPGVISSSGVDLAISMYNHATSLAVDYLYGKVVNIKNDKFKTIICEDNNEYTTKSVIIATGTKERLLNIPNELEMIGRGVSFCAVCDGAFFKEKDVVIVGGGNSALEEALYLTQFVNLVNIVIRRDVFRADPKVVDQILNHPKIKVIYQHVPKEVMVSEGKVSGLLLENVETEETQIVEAEGIFPYIGSDPMTSFVSDLAITNESGYLIVDEDMKTKIAGIFGAGDVVVKHLRQVVTAVNDGAIAAVSVSHYLQD
ncbi:MAG: thioredoxin-disulfide reductase [Erysipelotrichaceae bacterium]